MAFLVIPLFANAQAYILPADTDVCYGNIPGALRLKNEALPVKRGKCQQQDRLPG
jgi:hypothetical protein